MSSAAPWLGPPPDGDFVIADDGKGTSAEPKHVPPPALLKRRDSATNMAKEAADAARDAVAAAADAAFVYTDVWTSMGQETESQQRLADLAEYQVNQNIMNSARDDAKFLHCLPARRGEEVTAEIIDSPQSAIIQQANNRLHAQKGLVVWLLSEVSKDS